MQHLQERFSDLKPAMNLSLNESVKAMKANGTKIHHLGFGQSPFPVPEFAQKALRKNVDKAEYLAVKGLIETRESIVTYHSRLDKLSHFTPDDVIIGPGSKDLIFLLLNAIRGDVYLVSPTWTTYKPQAFLSGKKTHIIETRAEDGWKLTPELLQPHLSTVPTGSVLIFCNPDNPTGACYSEAELRALASAIRKSNLIVLSDEIYARLTYSREHSSIGKFLPERTIISSGISKWASCGGWRFGYHLYPKELRPVLSTVSAFASNSYTCCSSPIQYAAQSFMAFDTDAVEYAEHSARILAAVARYCTRVLTEAGVEVVLPSAGYYMFPDFEPFRSRMAAKGIKTGSEMCAAILEEAKVALLAGGPAFLHDESRLTVRLCFINFDGKIAMKASRLLGVGKELQDDFVKRHCGETVEAIDHIVQWLNDLPA